uniref:Cytochrome c oxidase subunit 2 n=1 Tax=Chelonarium sp. BMNH 840450 TaxID=1903803 RepID=A0A343A3I6_9COLE|nr:cytochrome c oxidase subunit 2 [Chelonarium sp. BMNH 840450]
MNMQDSMSPEMIELTEFHDHAMTIMTMIATLVGLNMIVLIKNKMQDKKMKENEIAEATWTSLPLLALILIGSPSIHTLYLTEEPYLPSMAAKVTGNQWYWTYEYPGMKEPLESYMKLSNNHEFRLLDVDNRFKLPTLTPINIYTTALDVIHAWTIPSMGIKTDATPGRLNMMKFSILKSGLLFGQCSEICGANHSFMPIVVECTPKKEFLKWMS